MRKYLSFIICTMALGAAAARAASLESGVAAHIHFVGGDAVSADPNSTGLKYLWTSTEAVVLRAQTLDKLGHSLEGWLHQQIMPNLAGPVTLRPLLDDLCADEWQLDLREPAPGAVEFTLAVRLDKARAQLWQTTLTPVLEAWKKGAPGHQAGLLHSGNWLLLQLGNTAMPKPAGAIPPLKHAWLSADVSWTRLAEWFPALGSFKLPDTHVLVGGHDGNFDLIGSLFLAQPLGTMAKWEVPAESIHAPIISFTAARGLSGWLGQQPWVASLGLGELPDQFYAWMMPQVPFQSYFAWPLPSAPAALPKLNQAFTTVLHSGGPTAPYRGFRINETASQISLVGMPLISPYFSAKQEAAGEFLLAGFFPEVRTPKPAPPELLAQLNQPGLVFYHWELTSARLKTFPELYQLLFVMSHHRQLDPASAASKWLAHVAPLLGASVTGATLTSPSEVTFSRKASAGLTAVELVALASWLEAPNFPGCDLTQPPLKIPHFRPKTPGMAPGAPAPAPGHH